MTLLKIGLLTACALMGQTATAPPAEGPHSRTWNGTAWVDNGLPKLYIEEGRHGLTVIRKPITKRCPSVVTVTEVLKDAEYRLDLSDSHYSSVGKLFNNANDEVATFRAIRNAEFARQVCSYFEGLKAAR